MSTYSREKHLEFIQGIINRMAGNSFTLKGWSVAIASALFAYSQQGTHRSMALLAILPAVCFAGLDAYYLALEKSFRFLFTAVSNDQSNNPSWNMEARPFRPPWDVWKNLLSPSVFLVHGTAIVIAIIIGFLT